MLNDEWNEPRIVSRHPSRFGHGSRLTDFPGDGLDVRLSVAITTDDAG
jgi:hypothetical protein